MKSFLKRVFVLSMALCFAAAVGCEPRGTSASDGPEVVVAVAVDIGSATSEGNAQRVLVSRNGEAASGWSRDPASMRRLDRLSRAQKDDVLQAATGAMGHVPQGEYAFGSKDGDWVRVVIVTSKRKLVFDEAAKKGAASPPAELRTIVNTMVDQANRR